MFEKNCIKLRIKDGYFEVSQKINDYNLKKISMPFGIYKDGKVLDYHHFFYRFKKMIDNLDFQKKDELILFFESSEFIHINYKIPKIEENEIEEFLKLELDDYGDFNLDEYKIYYESQESKDILNLSIELVPKLMIDNFIKILNKLEISSYIIIPESNMIDRDGEFVELGVDYLIYYKVLDSLIKDYRKIYNNNLTNLINENSLEEKNVKKIINRQFEPKEDKLDEEFLFKYKNYFIENIMLFGNLKENKNIYIYGSVSDSPEIQELIKNYSDIEYKMLGENIFNRSFKSNKKEKITNKIDLTTMTLFIGIILIILFNFLYFKNIDYKISQIPNININENSKEVENSSDKYQDRNKVFLNYILQIQKLEDKNLVITNYTFDRGTFKVKGIVVDENYLKKKFKDFEMISKNIYMENGYNKFEIEIK